MARVQKTNSNNKQVKQNTKEAVKVNPKSKLELAKTDPKKEPSKNEILFFRIGLIVIALTVIIGAVIVLINYYMDKAENEYPFDDYVHLTAENLEIFVKEDEFGNFGQRDYYLGNDAYEDINDKILANDIMYVYFYRKSDLKQEVVDEILALEDLETLTFFFIDMDEQTNLFQLSGLGYLNLNQDAQQMLLTFDYNPSVSDVDPFTLWSDTNNILIDLGKLA